MELTSYNLYQFVMSLSRAIFIKGLPPSAEQEKLVRFILEHQNPLQGFTFHPTTGEQETGLALVTGEPAHTRLLRFHAFELETLRLLALLKPVDPQVQDILLLADERLVKLCFSKVCITGECKVASIAHLRYRNTRNPDETLNRMGLSKLRQHRLDSGRWKGFPFFFTLLWLLELPPELSAAELQHTQPAIARALSASTGLDDEIRFQREILKQATRRF